MVRHNEHSMKFLQLTDLLHVLQVTLALWQTLDQTSLKNEKKKKRKERKKEYKKRKEENVMTRLVEAFLPPIC